ncbi:MAG: hypothetical protein Kow0047_14980 [Anaerolineae bacterium]
MNEIAPVGHEESEERPVIVCATRGGEASYRAQDRAIELALEHGGTLVFLFVADAEFVGETAAPIVVDVSSGLRDMGEFLLLMAQDRARHRGVEAKIVVRSGNVREEIRRLVQEVGADILVMGRPQPTSQQQVFGEGELTPFASEIQEDLGVKVELV